MLVHKSMHTPEGVSEMMLRTVEILRERIGGDKWDLCASDTVEGLPDISSTIGNGLHQGYNLVIGQNVTTGMVGFTKVMCEDVFNWLETNWTIASDIENIVVIPYEDMRELRIATRGEQADNYMPIQMQQVAVTVIDRERFINGFGWHHKAYYTKDELKDITYFQVFLSDSMGHFPWDAEYTGPDVYALSNKPFGEPDDKKELTAIDRARQRYMH